jgi:hypothetical protein
MKNHINQSIFCGIYNIYALKWRYQINTCCV